MRTPELKPCPFCRGKAELRYVESFREAYIFCGRCGARTEYYRSIAREQTEEDASFAWNRRTSDENA